MKGLSPLFKVFQHKAVLTITTFGQTPGYAETRNSQYVPRCSSVRIDPVLLFVI